MAEVRIAVVPGSLRAGSFNRKLAALAATAARAAGAAVDVIDLKLLALPVYDADIEVQEVPAGVLELRERIANAHGLFVATPEYNWGVPGGLKNAIDWASRARPNPFRDKWAAIASASPGVFGGVRAVAALRPTLSTLGVYLVPKELNVSRANEAFGPDGSLNDPKQQEQLVALVDALMARLR